MSEPSETGRFAQLVGRADKPVSPIPREAQPYQGHRAGLVTRFTAAAIDFFVVCAVLAILYIAYATLLFLLNPRSFEFPSVSFGEALLLGGLVLFLYQALGWWLTGRTYGTHVMGLRVVNIVGDRMHFAGAALRSALCVVFPIGLLWTLFSRSNRSVQDVVIRSSVVYDWSVRLDRPHGTTASADAP
jgi:uncharacterized RDD family membrane protein YckC